jgi:hypothetical protein
LRRWTPACAEASAGRRRYSSQRDEFYHAKQIHRLAGVTDPVETRH